MITWLVWAIWTLITAVSIKSIKLTHSLTTTKWFSFLLLHVSRWLAGLPSVTEFQYFVTEITLMLLKFSWNFGQNTEICLIFQLFLLKNTEICVKLCKITEIIAICYWRWVSEVGSPARLVQDCCNSIANALELLQSCTKLMMVPCYTARFWGETVFSGLRLCHLMMSCPGNFLIHHQP